MSLLASWSAFVYSHAAIGGPAEEEQTVGVVKVELLFWYKMVTILMENGFCFRTKWLLL